jgi:hypothetical protein
LVSIALITAASTWIGCGSNLAPVSGTVRLDGEPVGPGVILFIPDKSQGNEGKSAMGKFGPDGVYTLMTHTKGDGALVGHHRVVIRGGPGSRGGAEPIGDRPVGPVTRQREPVVPRKYQNVQKPLLSADVVPGGSTIDFNLEP